MVNDKEARKQSVIKAIESYEKRQAKKNPVKRRNNKPEKEVEKEVCVWLKANKFSYNVVEAKSTYSPKAGRYISQAITPGVCDIIGVDINGSAIFIELKAPGSLKRLRFSQFLYLKNKIEMNCFAVVIDSVERLERLYHQWLNAEVGASRKELLLKHLPVVKQSNDSDERPLFEE